MRCMICILEHVINLRERQAGMDRSSTMKDLLLYIAIGVLVVIAGMIFAFHQAKTGGSPNLPLKWLGFAGMTAIVFGYGIRSSRRLWGKQKFWVLLSFFFAVHSSLGTFALTRVQVVPLAFYAILTPIEYVVLTAYLSFFLNSLQ